MVYFSTVYNDIGIDLGLDKCAKVKFKKGRNTETHSIDLDFVTKIRNNKKPIGT